MEDVYKLPTVTTESCKQDKIEITIGEWRVSCLDVIFTSFIQALGSNNRENNQNKNRAFQANNVVEDFHISKKIKVLKKGSRNSYSENAPLFSGTLNVWKIRPESNISRYNLKLVLQINPTRFCVYQNSTRRIQDPSGNRNRVLSDRTNLFARQDKYTYKDEHSLDDNDNILLSPNAKNNGAPSLWTENLTRYINSIIDYMDCELHDHFSDQTGDYEYEPLFKVSYIENYWEFEHPSPIQFVHELAPSFKKIFNNTSLSEYPYESETVNGALCIRGNLKRGERIKIYAKSNKRIRLEVEYNFSKNIDLLQERRCRFDNLDELIIFICMTTTSLATTTAKTVIDNLYTSPIYSNILGGSGITLVKLINKHSPSNIESNFLLDAFIINKGIPTKNLPNQYTKIINNLILEGVVERKGRPLNRYILHKRFEAAALKLIS